ncbi:MAG: pyruvate kinase [Sphaerochaetaceae bacterium]|nr:pyruvate kinase [Sphaerochaetaceae bacterium]
MKNTQNYTKIVATIGPSSNSYEAIVAIITSGARVIRLNFSHGSHEEQQLRYDWARKASKDLDIPIAIFQDLQGPKIRLGQLKEGSFTINDGDTIVLTTKDIPGTKEAVSIDYPYLHQETVIGNRILIDDGLISLEVVSIKDTEIVCKVVEGGLIRPRKGVNLPGVPLHHLSSFTKKDERDLEFAFKNDVDYVALSFVRSEKDVIALKEYMLSTFGRQIPIISKIEKPEAVDAIEAIIKQSDAIMVARGDLGVEMFAEEVPIAQKSIIRASHVAGLPVITATQMLESMMTNPRPTRAETNDVANAVLDGTSAVMLSGETAAGKFPLKAVQTMNQISLYIQHSKEFKQSVFDQELNREYLNLRKKKSITEAVGLATRELALAVEASYIVCFTFSGSTARRISKYRPQTPIIACSPIQKTVQQLALSWGVTPILIDNLQSVDELLRFAPRYLKDKSFVTKGDTIVITAGVPVGSPGSTNMIKVVVID